jgi:hypothetical protein
MAERNAPRLIDLSSAVPDPDALPSVSGDWLQQLTAIAKARADLTIRQSRTGMRMTGRHTRR